MKKTKNKLYSCEECLKSINKEETLVIKKKVYRRIRK